MDRLAWVNFSPGGHAHIPTEGGGAGADPRVQGGDSSKSSPSIRDPTRFLTRLRESR